jgi:hypothetical protein
MKQSRSGGELQAVIQADREHSINQFHNPPAGLTRRVSESGVGVAVMEINFTPAPDTTPVSAAALPRR